MGKPFRCKLGYHSPPIDSKRFPFTCIKCGTEVQKDTSDDFDENTW